MRRSIFILTLLVVCQSLYGEVPHFVDSEYDLAKEEQRRNYLDNATIYFRIYDAEVDPTYLTNSEALDLVDKRLTDTESINHLDSITLMASASPDGPVSLNTKLAERRASALKEYLQKRYPEAAKKLRVGSSGEDWVGFRAMVSSDPNMPHRKEVLDLIDSDAKPDVKEWRIKKLAGGKPYDYLKVHVLPYLRSGASAIFHYDVVYISKYFKPEPIPALAEVQSPLPEIDLGPLPKLNVEPIPMVEIDEVVIKPLLAIKTNLLYDAVSTLNVEIEVPIGDKFSLAGEWIFPWWKLDSGKANSLRHRNQMLNANFEAKYWLGDRTDRPKLTGWHVGAYIGSGIYDFELSREGLQGDFYGGGVTTGYAHTINRSGNLRLEYSLAVGYFESNYHDYEAFFGGDNKWHPIRLSTNEFSWIGPMRARVSLVWMLNRKVNKRGGEQ